MENGLSLLAQLDGWEQWLNKGHKKKLDLGIMAAREYIARCSEGTHLVVVPKIETIIKACFRTPTRIIFDYYRDEDERKDHSRCYRAARNRLESELHKLNFKLWDYIVKQENRPPEVSMKAVKPDRLYKVLRFRDRTAEALRIISERQPGGFMVLPCLMTGEARRLTPHEMHEQLAPGQFALPAYVVSCWLLAHLDELGTGNTFEPLGCLGDDYRTKNDSGTWDHHSLQIRISASTVRYQQLNGDKVIPAIGLIPPALT